MEKTRTLSAKKPAKKSKKVNQDKKPSKLVVNSDTKCDLCTGSICCTYITHQIDKPRKMKDFDYLLWQISHENISVFKDEDGWFLSVRQPCSHLMPGGRCGIYDFRPEICREHSNEYCEFDSTAVDGFDLYFDDFKSLDEHCRKKFKHWDFRFEKWKRKRNKKKTAA